MIKSTKIILFMLIGMTFLGACQDDLDLKPEDNRETADATFKNPAAYKKFLAKLYAGFAASGQDGPAGDPDLVGLDEGFSQYMRLYFMMQELPTDEALIGWDDGTIKDLHGQNWTSGNEFIRTMYSRILYEVSLTNEFLRQTTPDKLDSRGVSNDTQKKVEEYRYEARFLRALAYYHGLDLFGNIPFVTEKDPIGAFLPEQIQRKDLFNYIEGELLELEGKITDARQNEYGRADKGAVWMLLSQLYLNAKVYTGTERNEDVIKYTSKVISAGYSLVDDYQKLFLADNNTNGAQNEIIFPITFDGQNTTSFGGMTFIIHAAIGGSMDPSNFGVNSGWAGLRTTPAFVDKFPNGADSDDGRAMIYTDGQNKEINNIASFTDGYTITKYKNLDVNGNQGSDETGDFPDNDFPFYRLADAYLMYAEANLRGGGGSKTDAVGYVNALRERAYGNSSADINGSDLTLNFILNERARELYWEGHRRTDLIRFNQFSENGVWAFKGNVPDGKTTEAYRNLMPIPATDLSVNTNLKQNPGY